MVIIHFIINAFYYIFYFIILNNLYFIINNYYNNEINIKYFSQRVNLGPLNISTDICLFGIVINC